MLHCTTDFDVCNAFPKIMKFIMTNTTCLFQVCGIHFVFLKRSYLRKWLENMTDPSGDSNVVATFLSKIASNIKASKHYLSERHSSELSSYDFSEFNAQYVTLHP